MKSWRLSGATSGLFRARLRCSRSTSSWTPTSDGKPAALGFARVGGTAERRTGSSAIRDEAFSPATPMPGAPTRSRHRTRAALRQRSAQQEDRIIRDPQRLDRKLASGREPRNAKISSLADGSARSQGHRLRLLTIRVGTVYARFECGSEKFRGGTSNGVKLLGTWFICASFQGQTARAKWAHPCPDATVIPDGGACSQSNFALVHSSVRPQSFGGTDRPASEPAPLVPNSVNERRCDLFGYPSPGRMHRHAIDATESISRCA
jgi:hypothetical protein